MPPAIRSLADQFLTDPVGVHIAPEQPAAEKVQQSVYHVQQNMKPKLLSHLLEALPIERAIVFTRTKHGADRVVKQLRRVDITSEAIHGNKSQNARSRTLDRFKSGKVHVLIATDVASRGIDVDGVSHVINYDLTHEPESYVHRIGRTARAGESGIAISFCTRDELGSLRAIERLLDQPIEIATDHPDYGDLGPPPEPPAPGKSTEKSRPPKRRQPRRGGKPKASRDGDGPDPKTSRKQKHRKGKPRGKKSASDKGQTQSRRRPSGGGGAG